MAKVTFKSLVEKYKLSAGKLSFWAPYWINEPGVRSGPFAGKGSPEELQGEVDKIFEVYQDPISSSEAARYLLLRNGLGVECAGFIFHVLDDYLKSISRGGLADYLFVPKDDLLVAAQKDSWKEHKEFTPSEEQALPASVPMRQVCEWFQRDAPYITNVERLTDESFVNKVANPKEIRPGDLVTLKSWSVYPHLGIITDVKEGNVEYFSSDFDPVGPGGITRHEITVEDLFSAKEIPGFNGKAYTPSGIWRPEVLDESS